MRMYRKNLRTEKGRSAPYDKDPETEKAGDQIPDSSVIKMFVNSRYIAIMIKKVSWPNKIL